MTYIRCLIQKLLLLIVMHCVCLAAYANETIILKQMDWPFDGMFGTVDRQAAQRGFQVYKEVCSACHGLHNVSYRNLKDIGFSDAEIKEIAGNYTLKDGPNDQGDMFDRAALPSDKFVDPYPNEQAARVANNGAYPPDLSLIVKARAGGADYIYSILTGYDNPPQNITPAPGLYFNRYFANQQIAMPTPLVDDQVTYIDGTKASVEQMARDVTIFLQWAAEPEMEHRKSLGLKTMFYLIIFTILFYIVKRRVWSDVQ